MTIILIIYGFEGNLLYIPSVLNKFDRNVSTYVFFSILEKESYIKENFPNCFSL